MADDEALHTFRESARGHRQCPSGRINPCTEGGSPDFSEATSKKGNHFPVRGSE